MTKTEVAVVSFVCGMIFALMLAIAIQLHFENMRTGAGQ